MSISCNIESDDAAWWWSTNRKLIPYGQSISKRCCSCKELIKPQQHYLPIQRWRNPKNEIEERIYGDDIPLAHWFVCEACAPILVKFLDMDVHINLGVDTLHNLLQEFEKLYAPSPEFKLKLPSTSQTGVWT